MQDASETTLVYRGRFLAARGGGYLYFSVKISERWLKARFEIIAQNKPYVWVNKAFDKARKLTFPFNFWILWYWFKMRLHLGPLRLPSIWYMSYRSFQGSILNFPILSSSIFSVSRQMTPSLFQWSVNLNVFTFEFYISFRNLTVNTAGNLTRPYTDMTRPLKR